MSLDQASDDELERVRGLVADALESAGIRWQLHEKPQSYAVAQVTIDYGRDSGRGVFVSWEQSLAEHESLMRLVREGDHMNPRILAADDEAQAVNARLQAALRAAGIESEDAENDFAPYLLRIVSAPGTA
ncbi:hypothetical protein [Glycomyces sp. NPDC021274]|uniref:hypothetical protein n=1 Tax=Glycomyces sp. NPDC021274 TaxID=3155120 RepID=UPI0033EFAFF2